MPAIEVSRLSFSYGQQVALRNLSFSVQAGRLFALLGPNGGGKTTLFRILSTLLTPDQGRAAILGLDVVAEAKEVRRKIGVVFQRNCLDPQLSVRENLFHQGRLYRLGGRQLDDHVTEVLDIFGLAERAGERLHALSGGLRRRAELARGLLHRPEVLLLDEPTAGLDPGARHDFWDYLTRLQEGRDMTILVTTHLLDEGERCHQLAILDQGRLVTRGSPTELKAAIGGDVVTLQTPDPDGLRSRIEETFQLQPVIVNGSVRLEHPEGHRFVARLFETFPGEIDSVTVGKPTLEDVFVRQTGHHFRGS